MSDQKSSLIEDESISAVHGSPHDQYGTGSATSDSERTMVTAATREVLAVIVSFGGAENLERWTERLGALLQQYAAGTEIVKKIVG